MWSMETANPGPAAAAAIRRAEARDAIAVADVLIRSRRAATGSIPAAVHTDDETRDWIGMVVIPEREVWLAESAVGEVVAMMVLDGGWIDQLYVDPAWTGKGIGTRLVELAKSRRPAGLQLWTFVTNAGARRFYERHGFVAVETTDGSHNEEAEPDIRFVWARP
jgi:GNAT superfamily N-acetyltransferase